MHPEQLSQIVTNISALHSVSVEALEAVVAKYPYFAVGHVLLLKKYQLTDATAFDRYLPIAAMHVADRKRLRAFIDAPIPLPEADDPIAASSDITEALIPQEADTQSVNQPTNAPVPKENAAAEKPEELPNDSTDVPVNDQLQAADDPIDTVGADMAPPVNNTTDGEQDMPPDTKEGESEATNTAEVHTFGDWLKRFTQEKVKATIPADHSNTDEASTAELLSDPAAAGEAFMAQQLKTDSLTNDTLITGNNPVAPDELEAVEGLAKKSVEMGSELVTETLAKIFLAQGNHAKALDTYEKLRLKYPEKSHYFASQIQKLQANDQ